MKNPYQLLNEAAGNPDVYQELPLDDLESQKIKQYVRQAHQPQKRRRQMRTWAAVICCAIGVGLFSQTATADKIMAKLVKTVQMDYISVSQYEYQGEQPTFYDVQGNPITNYADYKGNIYDDKGVLVATIDNKSLPEIKENELVITDLTELADHLCFTYYFPTELPAGFSFAYATVYQTSQQYASFYFTNDAGSYLYMQQRELTPDTAYEAGTDGTVEEIDINGYKAALLNGSSLDWEIDGTAVYITGRGLIDRDALLAMAESVEPQN